MGGERHAHLLVFEMQPERMNRRFWPGRTGLVSLRDGGDHIGMALDGRALEVMIQPAQTAHFLAAAGTSGTAVHQLGHRTAVACTLLCTGGVQHQNTPVVRRRFHNELPRDGLVGSDNAATQGPLAHVGQRNRVFDTIVRQNTRNRPKRLDLVHFDASNGRACVNTRGA